MRVILLLLFAASCQLLCVACIESSWKQWPTNATSSAGARLVPRLDGGQVPLCYAWGRGEGALLGLQLPTSLVSAPQPLPSAPQLVAVAAGKSHAAGLTAEGEVWAWGGSLGAVPQHLLLDGGETAAQLECGEGHALVRTLSGAVYSWGANDRGQLGLGAAAAPYAVSASRVPGLVNITSVAAGRRVLAAPRPALLLTRAAHRAHSLAVDGAGAVWAWGDNTAAQLGVATCTELPPYSDSGAAPTPGCASWAGAAPSLPFSSSPVRVPAFQNAPPPAFPDGVPCRDVAAGGDVSFALASGSDSLAAGTAFAWGEGRWGALGLGTVGASLPTSVSALPAPVLSIRTSGRHTLALLAPGTVWVWGQNRAAQLGLGSPGSTVWTPTRLPALGNITILALATGDAHSLAVSDAGEVFACASASLPPARCLTRSRGEQRTRAVWDGRGRGVSAGPFAGGKAAPAQRGGGGERSCRGCPVRRDCILCPSPWLGCYRSRFARCDRTIPPPPPLPSAGLQHLRRRRPLLVRCRFLPAGMDSERLWRLRKVRRRELWTRRPVTVRRLQRWQHERLLGLFCMHILRGRERERRRWRSRLHPLPGHDLSPLSRRRLAGAVHPLPRGEHERRRCCELHSLRLGDVRLGWCLCWLPPWNFSTWRRLLHLRLHSMSTGLCQRKQRLQRMRPLPAGDVFRPAGRRQLHHLRAWQLRRADWTQPVHPLSARDVQPRRSRLLPALSCCHFFCDCRVIHMHPLPTWILVLWQ